MRDFKLLSFNSKLRPDSHEKLENYILYVRTAQPPLEIPLFLKFTVFNKQYIRKFSGCFSPILREHLSDCFEKCSLAKVKVCL